MEKGRKEGRKVNGGTNVSISQTWTIITFLATTTRQLTSGCLDLRYI